MKKHPYKKHAIWALVLIIIFIAGIFAGPGVLRRLNLEPAYAQAIETDADLDLFWHVWGILDNKYPFDESEPDTDAKVYGAIRGLASSYDDPYTVFFPPEESKSFAEDVQGEFGGVGMEIGPEEGYVVVVSPLKGTPADEAGMEAGDIILAVDEESVLGMSVNEVVALIRGEKGTDVVLRIVREGRDEPFDISITRDIIEVPTVEAEFINDEIYHISLYSFTENSIRDLAEALDKFVASDASRIILDMRGNPGGYLSAAIDVASFFVPEGKVIVKEDFGEERDPLVYRSQGYPLPLPEDFAMVVLVDKGSASASEIVAGALRDYEIAELVGVQTFGKGSVQELINLPNKTSLKITVARWLTPKGVSISKEGLTPDHVIEFDREAYEKDETDVQLNKAVSLLAI